MAQVRIIDRYASPDQYSAGWWNDYITRRKVLFVVEGGYMLLPLGEFLLHAHGKPSIPKLCQPIEAFQVIFRQTTMKCLN